LISVKLYMMMWLDNCIITPFSVSN
jgi:hypothetical protein